MDEQQFRDVLKAFDDHNKSMLRTFSDSIKELITVVKATSDDHDVLIEIKTILTQKTKIYDTHIDESPDIRDEIKRNSKVIKKIEDNETIEKGNKSQSFINAFFKWGWALFLFIQALILKLLDYIIKHI